MVTDIVDLRARSLGLSAGKVRRVDFSVGVRDEVSLHVEDGEAEIALSLLSSVLDWLTFVERCGVYPIGRVLRGVPVGFGDRALG